MLIYAFTPVKCNAIRRAGTLDTKVLADEFFALSVMHEGRFAMTSATSPGIVSSIAKVSLSQDEFDREFLGIEEELRLRAKISGKLESRQQYIHGGFAPSSRSPLETGSSAVACRVATRSSPLRLSPRAKASSRPFADSFGSIIAETPLFSKTY